MKAIRRFTVRTVLPENIAMLGKLARNLRWSWHLPTRRLFRDLDPAAWAASNQDPLVLLGSLDRDQLQKLSDTPELVNRIADLGAELNSYLSEPRWYQSLDDPPQSIAYFSPEYGISAVLPQYSGGLGILAGDHLKAASDLGVPIVGVGLLYQSGYFKQSLNRDAWQQETYPVLDPDELPLTLLREPDGTPTEISLPLPNDRSLNARIWRADVGRVPLLLLDSNVPSNDDAARSVTDRLYGGGGDHRLQQELLLGMGGVKALRAFERLTGAPSPEVFHTNEGHAGFLGIERIRELMDGGLSWDEALAAGRASTVFTTHTPVPAGIDRFERDQIKHFFDAGLAPSVPVEQVLALGREDYDDGDPTKFNMAVMGLRLAQRANGVAKLHGKVSRGMFAGLWPGFDTAEVPIGSVTNGVHVPTWVDPLIADFAREKFGAQSVLDPEWGHAQHVDDADIWALRRQMREQLIQDVRQRLKASWRKRGASPSELEWTDSVLDPDVLTIGFARRVPTYKRLTLMLRDPARLKALLLDEERPIQLVIAGKSHPADEQGKLMIQDLVRFTDDPEVRHRIVFLPNYDIAMARTLFPGCDVWLNNPLRPLEACGTSGMKAAINGGLNLSVLDGWWDEMYDGHNGWAIPTAEPGTPPEQRDDIESAALYNLLETRVTPLFYQGQRAQGQLHQGRRDQSQLHQGRREETYGAHAAPVTATSDGVPHGWVAMVKHTLTELGPAVSAERMLQDYVQGLYIPACQAGRTARSNDFDAARQLAGYVQRIQSGWAAVSVEHVDSTGVTEDPHIGDQLEVSAYVSLGALSPEEVLVEAAYGRVTETDELDDLALQPMSAAEELGDGRYVYTGRIEVNHPGSFGYTVRVLPAHPRLTSSAELGLVANA